MKDAHALLQRAQKEDARVLLVGDTKQLSAVEAGNPFKSLQAGGITLARLDNSLRQKTEELRVAVRLISEGKVACGINVLAQAGCLQIEADTDSQINQMVSDYLALSLVERSEALLLAGTNQERLALVGQLRRSLQSEGTLGQNALAVSSLRHKDLTQVQAQYLVAYESGYVLMPTQDYKKQGLAKYQHYTVRSIELAAHRLVVETADGQLLSIDPAQCKRKTVYAAQSIDVAAGDRLRWTKNDRTTKTRNGQQFTVTEVLHGGIVRTVDEAGQSRWFSLSGHQHVDYAWVSTTYSAQGKTADRVLALMSEKTTNRESFYVAVSRAKHGLKLYAADKDELLKRAQVSKTKENASDYIPLFKVGEHYAETQKERQQGSEYSSASDGRDIGQRLGAGVGERLAKEFAAFSGRYSETESENEFARAGCTGDVSELVSLAGVLSEQVEPLSNAVAEYAKRAELVECEGLFTEAATAAHHGFEQLEQAAKDRNQLAAAVDRLDTAVRAKADNERSRSVVEKADSADSVSQERDYASLWRHYSQGIAACSETELDYQVGRQAFEDGVVRRVISLMLVSESSVVESIYRSYGKSQAIKYVNQTARRICQQQTSPEVQRSPTKRQMELE